MSDQTSLDQYLSEKNRNWLEERFYARVNAQARFEEAIRDPHFWSDGGRHLAMFSDHGVVHVRDVARQILQVLEAINGVLIPARPPTRLDFFMKGYGVMAAYLHDIGMADFSAFGRAMHPEFAAQAVFSPEFDDLIEAIWAENSGNVAWRLLTLARAGMLKQAPEIVLRELLALSLCHSKSKVPVAVLNDPAALRATMQTSVSTDLRLLYRQQQAEKNRRAPDMADLPSPPDGPQTNLRRFYADFEGESFRWLISEQAEMRELIADVADTLRALRCADALRQRGTVQKTSGGYEIFVNQQTGNAIYALRQGDDKLYLLEMPDPFSAGEANIASSELGRDGNLRITFHRGAFADEAALHRAAYYAAHTVYDIQADVIGSFYQAATPGSGMAGVLKTAADIRILLERVDDNPAFVELAQEQLQRFNPQVAGQARIVPSLQNVSDLERARYLEAAELDWDSSERLAALARLAQSGHKTAAIDPEKGFDHVKLLALRAGETLIEAGAPASFVYLPLGDGLKIIPLGGYQPFSVRAWMPLGNTGVIRGAIRNADVVADQDVSLLIIPKDVYLRHWHNPYTAAELRQLLSDEREL
jgi:hypothetical protein